jgi:3-hydroxyacyl-[acyl-carrier-protein] dehydratase
MELADEASGALSEVEATPEGLRAQLCVPPNAAVLAGHFPGHPVVPAVYLIEAACAASGQARGTGALQGVRTAKFLREVAPGAKVVLDGRLEALGSPEAPTGWILDAEFSLAGERAAVLCLDLAP